MTEMDQFFEPLDSFKNDYQPAHQDNVSEYFEELVRKSGIDEEANRKTNEQLKEKDKEIFLKSKLNKKLRRLRVLVIVIIIIAIMTFIVSVQSLFTKDYMEGYTFSSTLIQAIVSAPIAVLLYLYLKKKTNNTIKSVGEDLKELNTKRQRLYDEAWRQMQPLNDLYTWGIENKLMEKTINWISFDDYFDSKRMEFFQKRFNLSDDLGKNTSILYVKSGEVMKNPFLITKAMNFEMISKAYHGSRVVSWQETVKVNGKSTVQTRTQTLHATLNRPAPNYWKTTGIIYGNEATPKLTFSRTPQVDIKASEKQLEKQVAKATKTMDKKEKKSMKNDTNFTAMGNTEFEALFHALDRNNEVEYRMLFSPLAQRQILKILTDKKIGFGDDWTYKKDKTLNYIFPNHMKDAKLSFSPSDFGAYDIDVARKYFNEANNTYFKNLYFGFAPVLALPLFHDTMPEAFKFEGTYLGNMSSWQHEYFSNEIDVNQLKHELSVTDNILKTKLIKTTPEHDEIAVTAYGFEGIKRVDYVSVRANNGHSYSVPVEWIEYLPVQKTSNVIIQNANVENSDASEKTIDYRNLFKIRIRY